jgi:hypothetical protein
MAQTSATSSSLHLLIPSCPDAGAGEQAPPLVRRITGPDAGEAAAPARPRRCYRGLGARAAGLPGAAGAGGCTGMLPRQRSVGVFIGVFIERSVGVFIGVAVGACFVLLTSLPARLSSLLRDSKSPCRPSCLPFPRTASPHCCPPAFPSHFSFLQGLSLLRAVAKAHQPSLIAAIAADTSSLYAAAFWSLSNHVAGRWAGGSLQKL